MIIATGGSGAAQRQRESLALFAPRSVFISGVTDDDDDAVEDNLRKICWGKRPIFISVN